MAHVCVHGQVVIHQDSLEILWTGGEIPDWEDLPQIRGVEFQTIKKYEPDVDGYRFLHGVAITHFGSSWFISFGHNKGAENTAGEVANCMVGDSLHSLGRLMPVGMALENGAVSHGVFYNDGKSLWSLMGSFYGTTENVHTRAYKWNPKRKIWKFKRVIAESGFWPMQEPILMDNGNLIMAGFCLGGDNPPAVAIRKKGKITNPWKVIKIPTDVKVWGESTILVDGNEILLISRSSSGTPKIKGHSHPLAWVARSLDYGKSWSNLRPSNLPMVASKPYAGILSTGQRYLIATNTSNSGNERRPLTIALSRPGENTFYKILKIRDAVMQNHEVESHANVRLAYPYAIEYDRKLYVVYSNDGGKQGRKGVGRQLLNNNSAELAIIPLDRLQ